MNWIVGAICFLALLFIIMAIVMYCVLKRSSYSVQSSKYVLNKFEPDNTAPKLTEMIEFHKEHKHLSKYNIE